MTMPSLALVLQRVSPATGGGPPSTMHPAGPAAASIAQLSTVLIAAAVIVFVIVMALLVWPFARRADRTADLPRAIDTRRWEFRWIVVGGAIVPMVILAGVFALSLAGMRAEEKPASPYRIDVIGRQWWWEIRYPNEGVVTANEIHIPTGRPVRIHLESADVIHSFWVPQLQGKTDAITGQVNETWIQADAPGLYRGECAEFCGLQHAHMAFVVVAEGPDLTHVASRGTLASATIDNSPDNLARWIEHPDKVKPGTKMPPVPLDAPSLHALVTYLETLR